MTSAQREAELEREFTLAFPAAAQVVGSGTKALRQPYANDGELARAYEMGRRHGQEMERKRRETEDAQGD